MSARIPKSNSCIFQLFLHLTVIETHKLTMNGLYILFVVAFAATAVSAADEYCHSNAIEACSSINNQPKSALSATNQINPDDSSNDLINCNASYSGFAQNVDYLQSYANDHIIESFNYLLLAANFGTHVKNRPGFEKQFRGLSNNAWAQSIHLIKHINKRGGKHDFTARKVAPGEGVQKRVLELNELNALALALDIEKSLAGKAHALHERYSHANHKTHYDAEVAHYLEEEFIGQQAGTVRKLSGYTNDLKRLIKDSPDTSLSVFLFDEYLQKQ